MEKTTKIKQIRLFATPEDMNSHQKFLSLFHGSQGNVAQTCAWTTWNLASKLTEAPKGSYNITLTEREVNILVSTIKIGIKYACDDHKKELIKLNEELSDSTSSVKTL